MKKLIFSLVMGNLSGFLAFYMMYRIGIGLQIPLVQEYYLIPLLITIGYMVWDNFKSIEQLKLQNN
ncbi:MAG: hypothetical protein FH753_11195 [Firmicutes bacterium]|nr:hypothetical protein [Bacillota bacterium]